MPATLPPRIFIERAPEAVSEVCCSGVLSMRTSRSFSCCKAAIFSLMHCAPDLQAELDLIRFCEHFMFKKEGIKMSETRKRYTPGFPRQMVELQPIKEAGECEVATAESSDFKAGGPKRGARVRTPFCQKKNALGSTTQRQSAWTTRRRLR